VYPALLTAQPDVSLGANTLVFSIAATSGVFGTNFESVTAYKWPQGFWWFWGLCAIVTGAFMVLLRRWGMFRR
jgi:Mg2+ and Co2+ transporter CorA